MRAKSSRLTGCASGSARAAASISSGPIGRMGLGVPLEVVVLLMPRCVSGRDQPNARFAFCVSHEQDLTANPADSEESLLAVIRAIIEAFKAEGVFKHLPGRIEADAVFDVVIFGLVIIPFESFVLHRSYELFVICQVSTPPASAS